MAFTLLDVAGANFRTTREADRLNDEMMRALGVRNRFAPARLAIARSLALASKPSIPTEAEDDPGKTIKGDTLFGTGSDLGAWIALVVEHSGSEDTSRKEMLQLVAAHWKRGIEILHREWQEVGEDLQRFVVRLAESSGLRSNGQIGGISGVTLIDGGSVHPPAPVRVRVGEVATDVASGEMVEWGVNASGGSPHMAIMGSVGTGKTRTARAILEQVRHQSGVPMIAFDLKGDLREDRRLIDAFEAKVIEVPRQPIPLDVLAVANDTDTDRKFAAVRFQESFKRVKQGGFGANQMDALREATNQALRTKRPCKLDDVRDALKRVYSQRDMKPDGAMATFNQLCDFQLFEPQLSPAAFFAKSWILTFPATTEETRRMVSYLVLDCLDRWLTALDDTLMDESKNRGLRSLVVVDEAHRLLGMKQPALSNLVRMSRSKGGVVMLVSQKPDDFEGEEDDFVSDVGLFVCFRTNARPGAAQRVLQERNLTDLPDGVCVARLGGRLPVRIQAWQPMGAPAGS